MNHLADAALLELIQRKQNHRIRTGGNYEETHNQEELTERGWTRSMIERYLGNPEDVTPNKFGGRIYHYSLLRVLEAECGVAFQFELLSLATVRELGIARLAHLECYHPRIARTDMHDLSVFYANKGEEKIAAFYAELCERMPVGRPKPPAPPVSLEAQNA